MHMDFKIKVSKLLKLCHQLSPNRYINYNIIQHINFPVLGESEFSKTHQYVDDTLISDFYA